MPRVDVKWAWYDGWIGFYWDRIYKTLFICPLPFVRFRIRWHKPPVEDFDGMTPGERDVMLRLVNAWSGFLGLVNTEDMHPDDVPEFRHALHQCQNIIAARVAARHHANYWR